MADHVYTYDNPTSDRDVLRTVTVLNSDGVLCYPTDINWAFGCDCQSVKALERIRQLKPGHPKEQPFTLICSDIAMASTIANIEHADYRFLKRAWPGPFTFLLPRNRNLPRQLKDKRPIVGVRIPQSSLLIAIIRSFGRPLATTSVPMKSNGESFHMGWELFDEYAHAIDLLLDLGHELPGIESTIIDLCSGVPEIVREGAGDTSALFG